jgi:hypothetical protein
MAAELGQERWKLVCLLHPQSKKLDMVEDLRAAEVTRAAEDSPMSHWGHPPHPALE